MKIAKWLSANTKLLTNANIPTARLDCLVLLEDVTGKNRAHILAHPELELSEEQLTSLDHQVSQRVEHQPLAYVRGKTEFFGRDFIITTDVLEPRPESETMIELLLKQSGIQTIVDIGCGSGALGITSQLELPNAKVLALDIDAKCLRVTDRNNALHKTTVQTIHSNLLGSVEPEDIDGAYLLANLPYVPDNFSLNQAAMNEPRHAIFGGQDGLDLYRQLFEQIKLKSVRPKVLLCESLPTQHQALADLALQYGFTCSEEEDFIQLFS